MAHSQDHVVRHARRNLGPWIAFAMLAMATTVALYLAADAHKDANRNTEAIRAAGPPCVDLAQGPAIIPSNGCRRFYAAIANLCAQDPGFCRRSQKRAAKLASSDATVQQLEMAQTDVGSEGGGGSGNKPQSQPGPSPDTGGGQDNGGGAQPPQQPPESQQPPDKQPPVIDLPDVLDDPGTTVCKVVDPLVGPPVTVCPP